MVLILKAVLSHCQDLVHTEATLSSWQHLFACYHLENETQKPQCIHLLHRGHVLQTSILCITMYTVSLPLRPSQVSVEEVELFSRDVNLNRWQLEGIASWK